MGRRISNRCPECGAVRAAGQTCEVYFHQMLFWENEAPASAAEVHHLLVLSYHLQHPALYSAEGLREAIRLLSDFLDKGLSPVEVRQKNRDRVDSGRRSWKIKGTDTSRGSYDRPVRWTMTIADVAAGGIEKYAANVKQWARSILVALKAAGQGEGQHR